MFHAIIRSSTLHSAEMHPTKRCQRRVHKSDCTFPGCLLIL